MGAPLGPAECVVHLGRSYPREDPSCSGPVPTAKTTLNPAHVRPERRALQNEPRLDDTIKPSWPNPGFWACLDLTFAWFTRMDELSALRPRQTAQSALSHRSSGRPLSGAQPWAHESLAVAPQGHAGTHSGLGGPRTSPQPASCTPDRPHGCSGRDHKGPAD